MTCIFHLLSSSIVLNDMGSRVQRLLLLSVFILQLIITVERQVFDFLGYLWIPILMNFFNVIFIIFGVFGIFQHHPKYVLTYIIWCVVWIGWNAFMICFYLSVGALSKDSSLLNLGTGSVSWWEANGAGCQPIYSVNDTIDDPDPFHLPRPEKVSGCILNYELVEAVHSAIQCFLAILGIVGGMIWNCGSEKPKNAQLEFGSRRHDSVKRTSLYSIEFSSRDTDDSVVYDEDIHAPGPPSSPRPMTPRRVKRRSIISRGSTGRNSQQDRHNTHSLRNSHRNSNRRVRSQHQNPVTRIMEQQQNNCFIDSSTSTESARLHFPTSSTPRWKRAVGHANPLYQQDSVQSLNDEDICNNRPPSARSSYSNFHGSRPFNSMAPNGGITPFIVSKATPQVPVAVSTRAASTTFFKSGPPPYHIENVIDSETVI